MRTDPKQGIPATSWWMNADRDHFTEQCEREAKRMAGSRIARSLGIGMVIAQVDGKGKRQ